MNKEEAVRYFKIAADMDRVLCIYNYGHLLSCGESVESKKEAANYYNMSAGIERDKEKATTNIKMNADCMNHYVLILLKGNGVIIDKKEALKYIKMSIDYGSPDGMNIHRIIFLNGNGFETDKKESAKHCIIVVDACNLIAIWNYVYFYIKGLE